MWLQFESYLPNKAQLKVYGSFWLGFTLLAGWYTSAVFDVIYTEEITLWDGISHAAIFSFDGLLFFHLVWVFAQKRWTLPNKSHTYKHVGVHLSAQLFGFLISMILVVVMSIVTDDPANSEEHIQKQFAEVAIILLVCFAAILVVAVVFYVSYVVERNAEAQRIVIQSELKALRAQINPHFLFNSINSILALIKSEPNKAEFVLENLSEIFRYSLRSDEKGLVPLSDELAYAKMYLEIEQARFGDRLELITNIDESVHDLNVPPMILQPLVENSVKHVVNKIPGKHTISIHVEKSEKEAHIHVKDSGGGFHPDYFPVSNNGSTGLYNVTRKIELSTDGQGKVVFAADGVHIHIPIEEKL